MLRQLWVAGSLELVSRWPHSSRPLFLKPFPFSRTLSSLPCSSFPGGDDWASGGAIRHVFAQPFAGDQHRPGMPASSFLTSARGGAPQTLTKLFVFGSLIQLQYITY